MKPNRRGFLKGTAAGAAALAVKPSSARAQQAQQVATPSAAALAAETGPVSAAVEVLTADHPGSDFMVDILKSLGFEYVCANPGSSFRALHESIVNYG
jgi:acetolactate synthase-1/2/3 large subunit